MTADLSALIARLEAAEVGSRELDEAISDALCVRKTRHFIAGVPDELWMYEFDGHAPSSALRVTASLDAALALAERVCGEAFALDLLQDLLSLNFTCGLAIRDLPRLLCIAILRAKQGEG